MFFVKPCLSFVNMSLSSAALSLSLFQEDFDVTAFSCAPVPYTLEDLLCGRGVIRPPDYLVYPKNVRATPAVQYYRWIILNINLVDVFDPYVRCRPQSPLWDVNRAAFQDLRL